MIEGETREIEHTLRLRPLRELAVALSGDGKPAVLLGWSDLEALSRHPQYAWLSHEDAVFLRLPLTLTEIASTLTEVTHRGTPGAGWRQLRTPLGQMLWAVNAACAAVEQKKEEGICRLSELQRFVSRHWPVTFDAPLHSASQELSFGNAERAAEALQRIGLAATAAAVHHSLRWLDGGELGTALLEEVAIFQQASTTPDALDETDLASLVGRDWWSQARDRLSAAVAQIRDLTDAGISLPLELVEQARRLSEDLNALAAICSKLAKASGKVTGDLQGVVDWKVAGNLCQEVSDAVAWLRSDAQRVRRGLENPQPSRG